MWLKEEEQAFEKIEKKMISRRLEEYFQEIQQFANFFEDRRSKNEEILWSKFSKSYRSFTEKHQDIGTGQSTKQKLSTFDSQAL